jgi:hypothetical protein
MKITRLRVSNYRGIEALDECIGDAGAVVKGPNGAGKTSVLKAIRAALAGRDIGPDAIRHGASKAEILVDMGSKSVRRLITSNSSTLVVNEAGNKMAAPQGLLSELLGTSPLDPIELYEADAKKRKDLILRAMPVKLGREEAMSLIPVELSDAIGSVNFDAHGLEVVRQLEKIVYDVRRDVNSAAKSSEASAEEFRVTEPAGLVVSLVEADAAFSAADRELARLQDQAKRAREAGETEKANQKRIEQLLTDAEKWDATLKGMDLASPQETMAALVAESAGLTAKIAELTKSRDSLDHSIGNLDAAIKGHERALELRSTAETLKAALGGAVAAPVSEADMSAALAKVDAAKAAVERARGAQANQEKAAKHRAHMAAATELRAKSEHLTRVLDALRVDVPNRLLKQANGIPGLSLDGDAVLLDGTDITARCGQEQMDFAVEIARRVNAKSKILVVDGLERLDPKQFERFVRHATRDGYQLIGTRVDAGDVVFEAIEATAESAPVDEVDDSEEPL